MPGFPAKDSSLSEVIVCTRSSALGSKERKIVFKESEVVCELVPYVWTVWPQFVSMYCYRCGLNPDPAKPKRCSGCQYAHYCSKECQVADWKDRHKTECKILYHKIIASFPEETRDTWIMAFASIARLAAETEINKGVKSTLGLPVDREEAAKSLEFMGSSIFVRSIVHYFKELFDLCDPKRIFIENDLTMGAESFIAVYGAVQQFPNPLMGHNGNSSSGQRANAAAIGIQLSVAATPPFRAVSRGCVSNVLVTHELLGRIPPKSVVRAVKDIREGEELMALLEPRMGTLKNRKVYQAALDMICRCKACTDPTYQAEQCALKCGNRECTQPIPYDGRAKEPCPACGTTNTQRLKEAKEVIDDMNKWLDMPEGKIVNKQFIQHPKVIPKTSLMRQQIVRGTELLHPTNLLLGKACMDYTDWLRNTKKDDSPDYLPFLKRVLPSLEMHSNKYDYSTRNLYSDIVRAHVERKEYKDAQPYMDTLAQRLELFAPKTGEQSRMKVQLVKGAAALLRAPNPDHQLIFGALEETSLGRMPKTYRTLD